MVGVISAQHCSAVADSWGEAKSFVLAYDGPTWPDIPAVYTSFRLHTISKDGLRARAVAKFLVGK